MKPFRYLIIIIDNFPTLIVCKAKKELTEQKRKKHCEVLK